MDILCVRFFPKGMNNELISRVNALKLTCTRLECLDHYDTSLLHKNSFFLTKFFYFCEPSVSRKTRSQKLRALHENTLGKDDELPIRLYSRYLFVLHLETVGSTH